MRDSLGQLANDIYQIIVAIIIIIIGGWLILYLLAHLPK